MSFAEAEYIIDEVVNRLNHNLPSGIPPGKSKITGIIGSGRAVLTVTPPENVTSGGHVWCRTGRIEIRHKENSPILTPTEGHLVHTISAEQVTPGRGMTVALNGYSPDTTHHFTCITYSDHNVANLDLDGQTTSLRYDTPKQTEDWTYGYRQNFRDDNTLASIVYQEDNAGWSSAHINEGTGVKTLGPWANWSWLKRNRPFIVDKHGRAVEQLSETDYSRTIGNVASKINQSSGDIAGAFAWIPKIYTRVDHTGDVRTVKFTNRSKSGYAPIGFRNPAGQELEGVWIPMFYLNTSNNIQPNGAPKTNLTWDQEIAAMRSRFGSDNMVPFGGAISNVLRDILFMLWRSPDSQNKGGRGASESSALMSNSMVGGGQFYGTNDGKTLNKLFHSIVVGSYNCGVRDPYVLVNASKQVTVSKNYNLTNYSSPVISWGNSGTTQKMYETIPEFGDLPRNEGDWGGPDDTRWMTDRINASPNTMLYRYGTYASYNANGQTYTNATYRSSDKNGWMQSVPMMLPPVGYSPAVDITK